MARLYYSLNFEQISIPVTIYATDMEKRDFIYDMESYGFILKQHQDKA